LTQLLESWHRPVAYLPKQLDTVFWGWPPYLHILAVTAILVAEAEKLTLGQELTVQVPYSVLKYGQQILELLETVWAPEQVAVMHCWGHQRGNQKADREAKQATLTGGQTSTSLTAALFPCPFGTHSAHHKNRLGLRLRREIFYLANGGSLPSAVLQFQNH
jgi:hypothetical protein